MKRTKRYSLCQVELGCCLCKSKLFKTMKEVLWYCCTKLNLTRQEMMFIKMKEFNNIIYINCWFHSPKPSYGYTIDIQNEENEGIQFWDSIRRGHHEDGRLSLGKNLKRHFFEDIENSFHEVTRIGLEPHQFFFFSKYLTKYSR